MKYRITTDHTVEASGVEDAMRTFATVLMQAARAHSEDPKTEVRLETPAGATLSIVPVAEG